MAYLVDETDVVAVALALKIQASKDEFIISCTYDEMQAYKQGRVIELNPTLDYNLVEYHQNSYNVDEYNYECEKRIGTSLDL